MEFNEKHFKILLLLAIEAHQSLQVYKILHWERLLRSRVYKNVLKQFLGEKNFRRFGAFYMQISTMQIHSVGEGIVWPFKFCTPLFCLDVRGSEKDDSFFTVFTGQKIRF